jgi:hypothetical protein
MTRLHDSLTVIDGLVISKWSRAVFADMREGGLTAANCTCSIWEITRAGHRELPGFLRSTSHRARSVKDAARRLRRCRRQGGDIP